MTINVYRVSCALLIAALFVRLRELHDAGQRRFDS